MPIRWQDCVVCHEKSRHWIRKVVMLIVITMRVVNGSSKRVFETPGNIKPFCVMTLSQSPFITGQNWAIIGPMLPFLVCFMGRTWPNNYLLNCHHYDMFSGRQPLPAKPPHIPQSLGFNPDNKVHGANMGPTWVLSVPDGPHVGPMNLAIRDTTWTLFVVNDPYFASTSNCQQNVDFDWETVRWSHYHTVCTKPLTTNTQNPFVLMIQLHVGHPTDDECKRIFLQKNL